MNYKNVLFENEKIVIYKDYLTLKKKNIDIQFDNIEFLYYAKWSIKNYFLTDRKYSPGYLYIQLKKHSFFRDNYAVRISYDNILKLPKKYTEILELHN